MGGRGSVLALIPLLAVGCQTSRTTARCSIIASPASATTVLPPKLTSMALNPTDAPVRMSVKQPELPVHCSGPLPSALRGSPVDDLTAIWVGQVTWNGQPRRDCPAFPARLTREDPQLTDRPCGESACPNQQVAFGRDGVTVHVLFYDDPSLHDMSHVNQSPSGACYYRVYAMSVAWDGDAPQ